MYKLTLTKEERKAIDWVGHRDWNGESLYVSLWVESESFPNDIDWDENGDITFTIPESVAWDICENWKSSDRQIPHFSEGLKGKVLSLIKQIIKGKIS